MSKDAVVVSRSPNRSNIFLGKALRGSSNLGDKAYEDILQPIADNLLLEKTNYPMTIIYLKLKYCGLAYSLFERTLKGHQYASDGDEYPANRLFCQYHSPQTDRMKKEIMTEIMKKNSAIRVIFATSALGKF